MSYGTWLASLMASAVGDVEAEMGRRLAPLCRQIGERVASFFGPRPFPD